MIIYILIIFMASYKGGGVTQIEYSKKEDCEQIAKNVRSQYYIKNAFCVEKK